MSQRNKDPLEVKVEHERGYTITTYRVDDERCKYTYIEYNLEHQIHGKYIIYQPSNQNISAEYTYVNGVKEGRQIFYHANGQVQRDGYNRNNSREGVEVAYHENGAVSTVAKYKNNLAVGKINYWHTNGQVFGYLEYNANNNEIIQSLDCFDNGKPEIIRNYRNNQFYGPTIKYYKNKDSKNEKVTPCIRKDIEFVVTPDIQKKEESNFSYGLLNGECKYWYENGQLKETLTYKQGSVEGPAIIYYENGNKMSEVNYINGHKEGNECHWHNNGQKNLSYNFINDKKEGLEQKWDPDGFLLVNNNYTNDAMHGTCTKYERNERETYKIEEREYLAGSHHGKYTLWYNATQIKEEGIYTNGFSDGECKKYYQNGYVKEICIRVSCVKRLYVDFHKNGRMRQEINYLSGVREGTHKKWYLNGDKKQTFEYIDGSVHGKCITWHKNGKISMQYEYSFGNLIETIEYNEEGEVIKTTNTKEKCLENIATLETVEATPTNIMDIILDLSLEIRPTFNRNSNTHNEIDEWDNHFKDINSMVEDIQTS